MSRRFVAMGSHRWKRNEPPRAVAVPIYAFTDDEALFRQLLLPWGVEPFLMPFSEDPEKTIEDAVVKGFKIAVSREKDDSEDSFAIVHGTKFVLVDGKREIRGYYDTGDGEALARLRSDLTALAEGGQ